MKIKKKLRNALHFFYAVFGALYYRFPSRKLFVIGITGTSGKSTTTTFLRTLLEDAGYRVGSLSTVDFYVAGEKKINDKKMTMLGRFQIQKYLRQMVDVGCDVAIVETTSEGGLQHRHRCIAYDYMILTNLYPEHIESHGGYDKYAKAKQGIFTYVASLHRKHLSQIRVPKDERGCIPKIAFIPAEVDFKEGFADKPFDQYVSFGPKSQYEVSDIRTDAHGVLFVYKQTQWHAPLLGVHNINNIICAVTVLETLGVSLEKLVVSVSKLTNVEGRLEFIPEAKQFGFSVIVDYAFEPVAIQKLYDTVLPLKPSRIIHVCGSTGGGRDVARRGPIGVLAGKHAQIVIVTNEDPYDEDPMEIIHQVSTGAVSAGKKLGETVLEILDRQEAIDTAILLARAGDMVLVTGKGSEQGICVANREMLPWDDREAVRRALKRVKGNT